MMMRPNKRFNRKKIVLQNLNQSYHIGFYKLRKNLGICVSLHFYSRQFLGISFDKSNRATSLNYGRFWSTAV